MAVQGLGGQADVVRLFGEAMVDAPRGMPVRIATA